MNTNFACVYFIVICFAHTPLVETRVGIFSNKLQSNKQKTRVVIKGKNNKLWENKLVDNKNTWVQIN